MPKNPNLKGETIKSVRAMTEKELAREYWEGHTPPTVIELENGTLLYASRDGEGNGPGVLFGTTKDGTAFAV